jgi:hypothetical protein
MRIIGWLRNEDAIGMGGRLDKVVGADICHDLRAGVDFCMELALQPAELVARYWMSR